MNQLTSLSLLLLLAGFPAFAQRRVVQAVGSATISAQPDQVKVDIGVSTMARTAQEAATQNATQMSTVLNAIRTVLGPTVTIPTVGYSITPNYNYPQGQPPVLLGYTATNTVEVTTGDSTTIAKVIDAAVQAGATNIAGLRFTVANDDAVRQQALGMAAKQAMAHAQAIAGGLGAKVGNVITAQEGVTASPIIRDVAAPGAAAPTTPIQPGLVQITATVTVDAELVQ